MESQEKVQLTRHEDGTLTEGTPPNEVYWLLTTYTEPREMLSDCVVCELEIEEWDHYVCLDGGESAHPGCVEIGNTP